MSESRDHPYAVEVVDPLWIGLNDGVQIACTVWQPVCDLPVPAVVEMVPYRRRDGTAARDAENHSWMAGHGIACVRVDLRGTGDSDGHLADEYLEQEHLDACEIISHIAALPWCNGNVGMTGISWGGFNALQVAARRPPELKAIITLCASDDRYADDIHYMGGALITEQEMWSNFMLVKKAMPPDPQIVGARWRAMWDKRLAATRSLSEIWLAHQRRDDYWKHGSVCEDYAAIECAVMAVCGWDDSYSNFVPRLLQHLTAPKLAIMGPWTHVYPNRASPGPKIGYLQEALRFWKHWLSGENTGIMAEPMYRVWIIGEEGPRPYYEPDHAGRWVAEQCWPSPRIEQRRLWLWEGTLADEPSEGRPESVCSPVTAGRDCGRWGGYGGRCPDMAIDQRREDAIGLSFDTPPVEEDTTLLGAPVLELEVIVDQPHVTLTVRLCDVYPDGTSALMTYGVLNLSHRDSHEHPSPCPVGTPFRVALQLNDLGRTVAKGHRIRVALATQHWPIVWPQPKLATLTVVPGSSSLTLPVRPGHRLDDAVRFEPAEIAAPLPSSELRPSFDSRIVEDDVGNGNQRIRLVSDHGATSLDDRAITVSSYNEDVFEIRQGDPLSARLTTEYRWAIKSGEADTEAFARTELTADETHLYLTWRLEARDRDRVVHSAAATSKIPRDYS